MGGRYCAVNSALSPRWGQKSLNLRSRDFCPHLEPRGELIAQYQPPMSFRYKMHVFRLKFLWNLFLGVKSTIYQHWFRDNGLAPTRRQAIIWTNDGLEYRCIYASLGLNELFNTSYDCPCSWEATLKNIGSCMAWIHKYWQYNHNRTIHITFVFL